MSNFLFLGYNNDTKTQHNLNTKTHSAQYRKLINAVL